MFIIEVRKLRLHAYESPRHLVKTDSMSEILGFGPGFCISPKWVPYDTVAARQ